MGMQAPSPVHEHGRIAGPWSCRVCPIASVPDVVEGLIGSLTHALPRYPTMTTTGSGAHDHHADRYHGVDGAGDGRCASRDYEHDESSPGA